MKQSISRGLSLLLVILFLILSNNIFLLSVRADSKPKERDIALILDVSGSMAGKPIEETKKAAKSFCETVLSQSADSRISVVTFETSVSTMEFTSDLDVLKERINNIEALSLTNMEGALSATDKLFVSSSREDITKSIVIMSDGIPNEGSTYYETDMKYPSNGYSSSVYNTVKSFNNKYDIYSLGFFHNLLGEDKTHAKELLTDIQNKGYYEVTNAEDLIFTFGDIAEDINQKYPIIVVPGVMGSRLYQFNGTKVWPPEGSLLNQMAYLAIVGEKLKIENDLYVRKYQNQNTKESYQEYEDIQNDDFSKYREYGALDTYKKLIDQLCENFPEREIYFFSYDFRKSNVDSAKELQTFIDGLKSKKVDIVSHSMGGLVASNYVASNGADKINKIVTLGTPYEGAPKLLNCVLNWDLLAETSEKWDIGQAAIDSLLGGMELLTKNVKSKFPSVAELSPTKNYVDSVNFYKRSGFNFLVPEYQSIDYNEYKKYANIIFGDLYPQAVEEQNKINVNGFNILTTLDNSYFGIGTGKYTMTSIKFKEGDNLNNIDSIKDFYLEDLMFDNNGDGTVPLLSATVMGALNTNVPKDHVRYFDNTTHGQVVGAYDKKDTRSQLEKDAPVKWVVDILKSGVSQSGSSQIQPGRDYIVIKIACPVGVQVSNGKEYLNSNTNDVSTETSFGNLSVIGQNDDIKIAVMDKNKDYAINLNGTGEGTMEYVISWFNSDNSKIEERNFKNVPITSTTKITTGTDDDNETILNIDIDGDGKVDEIWKAGKNSEGYKMNLPTQQENVKTENISKNINPTTSDNIIISFSAILIGMSALFILIAILKRRNTQYHK